MPTFSALLGVFPNLIVQVLLLLPRGQRIVMYTRFCTSILIMMACLVIVLLPCFIEEGSSITEATALVILLLSITACGAATGLIQATIFSFTAELPPIYTGTAMTGMALSGLIASILRIISKASNATAPLVDAAIYFGVAISILVLTLLCIHFFLKKNPYALHHTHILSGETPTRLHSRRRRERVVSRVVSSCRIQIQDS